MNPTGLAITRLDSSSADFDDAFARLLHWDTGDDSAVDQRVAEILAAVRQRGLAAVLEYTRRFDALDTTDLRIPPGELAAAWDGLDDTTRKALEDAHARIVAYHRHQIEQSWSFTDAHGNELGQKITALDRVGVYVPGGQASYPSSVLMTIAPARVAGVGEVIVTVPTPGGERNPAVLAALHLARADRVFSVGGAQAIGALAYGAGEIPRVDKIVGPGNAYVA
ncbi:MAG: histidinol dehydrogenase, partial [Pseudomonadota bacterium]